MASPGIARAAIQRRQDVRHRSSRAKPRLAIHQPPGPPEPPGRRNAAPVIGIVVSVVWNQVVLRRFARRVHTAVRQRQAIVHACRDLELGKTEAAARTILDGAWLIATADGDIQHEEALALSTLIDSLSLPERIAVQEASFSDDEEEWFERLPALHPATHRVLVQVLVLIAGVDGDLNTAERRFLRRLG